MNLQTAVKTVLSKYATFTGRASRSEFWWFTLFIFILSLVLAMIEGAILAPMSGILVLLYWYIQPGTESPNDFGQIPLEK